MKEKNFKSFVELLRFLKKGDSEKSSVKETIINMVNNYEKDLTQEQRADLLKDLVHYEKKRQEKLNAE